MPKDNVTKLIQPGSFEDPLTQVLRDGARNLYGIPPEIDGQLALCGMPP